MMCSLWVKIDLRSTTPAARSEQQWYPLDLVSPHVERSRSEVLGSGAVVRIVL